MTSGTIRGAWRADRTLATHPILPAQPHLNNSKQEKGIGYFDKCVKTLEAVTTTISRRVVGL
jgi:hypothetical protein